MDSRGHSAFQREVIRFWTLARKFPKMFGRFHDGTRIPGGPYTSTQGGVFFVIAGGLVFTRDYWCGGNIIVAVLLGLVVGAVAGFLAGLLPIGARSPLVLLVGFVKSLIARPRFEGAAIQEERTSKGSATPAPGHHSPAPRPAAQQSVITEEAPVSPTTAHQPVTTVQAGRDAGGPATGLERLLSQTGAKEL
ncbi:hypothetical protein [Arthrobacter woluwensis]|uniref:hypothetical protein n=1 Tax=Arthrobacter woluwensis TaxID=156980 RepID=UPI0038295893